MLGDGESDPGDVGFLEAVAADQIAGDVAGDDDHGDGIHVGGTDTGHEVGGAGAGGGEADAGPAAGPSVAVGGVGGALLVTDEDVLDLGVFAEAVVEREHDAAWIAENEGGAFGGERFEQDLCAVAFHGVASWCRGKSMREVIGRRRSCGKWGSDL